MSLGRTVSELLASTSAHELAEWRAYERLEPFGERRADIRAGVVASTIYNMNRGKDAPALTADDFFPSFKTIAAAASPKAKLANDLKAALQARK